MLGVEDLCIHFSKTKEEEITFMNVSKRRIEGT